MPKQERQYEAMLGPDIDLEAEDVRDLKGNRIDEQYVRRAVEDVHAHLARAGRPSLTEPGKRSPQVTFRLSESLLAAAEARARREQRTVSAVAREALEEYLARSSP